MCNLTLLSNAIEGNLSSVCPTLLHTIKINSELANCSTSPTMGSPTMNIHCLTHNSSIIIPSPNGNLIPMTTPSFKGNQISMTSSPVANGNQESSVLVTTGILFGVSILLVIGISITCNIVIIRISRKSKICQVSCSQGEMDEHNKKI